MSARSGHPGRDLHPEDGPLQAFASGLRRLREDAGLSLAGLAQRANYAQGTMSKATDGRTWPTEPVVRAYVVACGGDPGDWLARREAGMKAASATSDISPAPDGADAPASPGAPPRNPPRRWPRWLLPAVAVVAAVVVAIGVAARPGKSSPALLLPGCAGPATARLEIAASQDLAYILAKAAGEYGLRSAAGQCMQVSVEDINSGTAMTALARGWTESDGTQPDVWSPASDAWLTIARARARGGAAARLPAQQSPLIVTAPLVIAMPEPMARVLGWPKKKIGWNDLESWARTPDFWA
ncbi:MAG TPA: helix-turn-helix transcriptional regulator, partial [Trebonia sp.]|nr:helix-turn-helix transcriptional regulator [Trebonia sp.]